MGASVDLLSGLAGSVRAYAPLGEQQRFARLETLALLSGLAPPTSRDNPLGHVTASAVVLRQSDGAALLTFHAKFEQWLSLGGHFEDSDVDLVSAASREVFEESGLTSLTSEPGVVDIEVFPGSCKGSPGRHYDLRVLLVATGKDALTITGESLKLAWFAPGEFPPSVPPGTVRAVAAARHVFAASYAKKHEGFPAPDDSIRAFRSL